MVEIVYRKKDRGTRTGKSGIKFKRIAELKTTNEQVFIEIVTKQREMMVWTSKCRVKIGNHRCS